MSDEPTPSELARLIERNHRETSSDILDLKTQVGRDVQALFGQMAQYVLTAVYEADKRATEIARKALEDKVERVEEELTSTRRGNRTAFWAAVGAIIAAMAGAALAYMFAKGGK